MTVPIGQLSAVLTADVSDFQAGLAAAGAQLDLFGAKAEAGGTQIGASLTSALAGVEAAAGGAVAPLASVSAGVEQAAVGLATAGGAAAGAAATLGDVGAGAAAAGAPLATLDARVASLQGQLASLTAQYLAGAATEYEYVTGLALIRDRMQSVEASAALATPQLEALAAIEAEIASVIGPVEGAAMGAAAGFEAEAVAATHAALATQNLPTLLGLTVAQHEAATKTGFQLSAAELAAADAAEIEAVALQRAAAAASAAVPEVEAVTISSIRSERAVTRFGMGAMMMASATQGGIQGLRGMSFGLMMLLPQFAAATTVLVLATAGIELLTRAQDKEQTKLDALYAKHAVAVTAETKEGEKLDWLRGQVAKYTDELDKHQIHYAAVIAYKITHPFSDLGAGAVQTLLNTKQLTEAQDKLNEALHTMGLNKFAEGAKQVQAMTVEVAKLGMSTREAALYTIALDQAEGKLTETQAEQLRGMVPVKAALESQATAKAALKDTTQSLVEQIAHVGMTAAQWAAFQVALKGVGAEGQRTVYALTQTNGQLQAQQKLIEAGVAAVTATETPGQKYAATLRALDAALVAGKITQEGWNRAVEAALAPLTAVERELARVKPGQRLDLGLGGAGNVFGLPPAEAGGMGQVPLQPGAGRGAMLPEEQQLNELLAERQKILDGVNSRTERYASDLDVLNKLTALGLLTEQQRTAALAELSDQVLSRLTPRQDRYAEQLALINQLHSAGGLANDQYALALRGLDEQFGLTINVGQLAARSLQSGFSTLATTLGQAAAQGRGFFSAFGEGLQSFVGNVLQSVGGALIGTGAALALIDPGKAALEIAAGTVIMGIGAGLSASASGGGGGGGGGGGFNPNVANVQATAATQGNLTIVFPEHSVFDPGDPRTMDLFQQMAEAAKGRHVIVRRRA